MHVEFQTYYLNYVTRLVTVAADLRLLKKKKDRVANFRMVVFYQQHKRLVWLASLTLNLYSSYKGARMVGLIKYNELCGLSVFKPFRLLIS